MTLSFRLRNALKWVVSETLRWTGVLRLLERTKRDSLRILVFHRVSDIRVDDGMTVSAAVFEAQVRYLTQRHHMVPLEQVGRMLRGEGLFRGGVAVTFDDGYRDNYTRALPALTRHKIPATIFLAVGAVDGNASLWTEELREALWATARESVDLKFLGWESWPLRTEPDRLACLKAVKGRLKTMPDGARQQVMHDIMEALEWKGPAKPQTEMLTWEMAREMRKAGIAIGAHTVSHKILTRITRAEAEWEIAESKRRIEKEVGEPVRHFAYPNGTRSDWNPEIQEMVKQAGFETACTTVRGANPVGHDAYALRRLEINDAGCTDPFGRFSLAMFAAQLVGLFGGWER